MTTDPPAPITEDWLKSAGFKWHQFDRQTDTLKAVLATLEWLRANEVDVRAFVAERPEARKQNGDDRGAVA
jgi:hypothetical protein